MNIRRWSQKLLTLGLGALLFAAAPSMVSLARTFPEGLYAGDQSLGGMTEEEADEAARACMEQAAGQQVVLDIEGTKKATTAQALGFTWKNPQVIQEAADQYLSGSLVRQYMNARDLKEASVSLPLEAELEPDQVQAFVEEQSQGLLEQPRDASITREDGQFIITDSVAGEAIDLEATQEALNRAVLDNLGKPAQASAIVTVQEPRIRREDLETIQDVLGTFTTSFASSGAARSTNLAVGAEKINGHLLMPGEVLSGYECLQPFTTDNGYKTAAAYENGQVVDSVGGGVCQIATTLYNMALNAELEVVQRQNHSMIVTYVKPSQDAAIAGTYKDIKIKNNYSTPIYVEGYTKDKNLTFTVYGQETRPENRQVTYVSETLKRVDPGEPQQIVDNSLAPGARVKVQSSHAGLQSRLWKVVTVEGVETERTILHTDTYNASRAIYRVGPAQPVVAPPNPAEPTETEQPTQAPAVEGVDGGPGVSQPQPQQENQEQPEDQEAAR